MQSFIEGCKHQRATSNPKHEPPRRLSVTDKATESPQTDEYNEAHNTVELVETKLYIEERGAPCDPQHRRNNTDIQRPDQTKDRFHLSLLS